MGITLIPAIVFVKNGEISDTLFGVVSKKVVEKQSK